MGKGLCSKCGQERALMRSGLCGSCVRSAALNGAGPVQPDLRSNALPVVQDNNVLVKKIDSLLSRVDGVAEDITTVKGLVRDDSEDESEDDEAPGQMDSPGELDEDEDEDDDEDQPAPDDSGGASGFIIALFLVLFVALAFFLWLGGGLIKAARNRFLSDGAAKTTDQKVTVSS